MASRSFALDDVLAVAHVHPFYSDTEYPATRESLPDVLAAAKSQKDRARGLKDFPLTRKESLYKTIQRLSADTNPRNGYRRHGYVSVTGGGSGGTPMVFVTDSAENRRHRDVAGSLLRTCRLIEPGDWMLTMHISGFFYRALDLLTELVEQAGGTVFCAGIYMPHSDIVEAIEHNRINVISGDGSQVVQLVAYIATLPPAKREAIKITKVLYTSEPLARTQRAFIKSVLGPVAICSVLGSAEAGPWAVANLDLTGDVEDDYMEFIFDTRTIVIEILPLSVEDPDNAANGTDASTVPAELPQGEIGIVVQTSLQRLRNPLVRYLSGDLGSLHPLPASALANVPTEDAQHLKLLRLYGRDRRFSFKWYGEYFVFDKIEALMRTEELGIMQWQIVLSYMESTPEIAIEIRVFRPMPDDGDRRVIAADELVETLKKTFGFLPSNAHLFRVTFVRSHEEFERSKTGNKVIKLVDRTKKK